MPAKKLALITGGAKRVGRAISEQLARDGFEVAFTYHSSRDEAETLAKSLGAQAINANLTDPTVAVKTIADALGSRVDQLAVLVNSASIYLPGDEKLREMMAIHVESPLLLCRRFEKALRANHGCVINMVDLLAERPWPAYAAYCASKAALWNLTLSLARDLAPEARVNGVAPGVVDWPADFPESKRQAYLERVPLRRAGTPNDVAALVSFLTGAGSYITGQIIRLDGGKSIL
jgi:pteridine reductase